MSTCPSTDKKRVSVMKEVHKQKLIQIILVCQGVEYQAVRRGLNHIAGSVPAAIPIPVGINNNLKFLSENQHLQNILNHSPARVLVMGLCGSLTSRYKVGEFVLYRNNIYRGENATDLHYKNCDRAFTDELDSCLGKNVPRVTALSCDRPICSAAEKRHLQQTLGADVVDMEGFAILKFFEHAKVPVAMLRVVSDECDRDIPNLDFVLDRHGFERNLALALAMLRQPIATTRLIRGSLKALKVLEQVTTLLFKNP